MYGRVIDEILLGEMREAYGKVDFAIEKNLLSEEEKEFWRTQEEKIENPMVFHYAEGYSVLLSSGYTIGFLAWQVVPVLYVLFSGVMAFVGKRIFIKYEVSGR